MAVKKANFRLYYLLIDASPYKWRHLQIMGPISTWYSQLDELNYFGCPANVSNGFDFYGCEEAKFGGNVVYLVIDASPCKSRHLQSI